MTTLTSAPIAPLLDRLFEEADAAMAETEAVFADLSDAEQARLMHASVSPSNHVELELVQSCCLLYVLALDAARLLVHLKKHQHEIRAGSDFAGAAFRCFDGMIAPHPKLSRLENSSSSRRNAC